jgi:hypothetical protein
MYRNWGHLSGYTKPTPFSGSSSSCHLSYTYCSQQLAKYLLVSKFRKDEKTASEDYCPTDHLL